MTDISLQEFPLDNVPLLPLKDVVIFPGTQSGLAFGRSVTRLAIDEALRTNNMVVFVAQKEPEADLVEPDDLYRVGTLGIIRQVLHSDADVKVVAEGLARVRITNYSQAEPFYRVDIERLPVVESDTATITALKNTLTNQLKSYVALRKDFDMQVLINILSTGNAHRLVDLIASQVGNDPKPKQDILEELDLEERLAKTNFLLAQELHVAELEQHLTSQTQEELSKMQKEVYLREQMKTIQRELGEGEAGVVPAPVMSGNASGTMEPVLAIRLDLNSSMPSIISRPMRKMMTAPASAKLSLSTPKSRRILWPRKRNATIRHPATKVASSALICPSRCRIWMIIGMEPMMSITAKSVSVTENIC